MTHIKRRMYPAALLITASLLLLLLLLANRADAVSAVLHQRIMLCLQTLIPSLFGCMAIANLLWMTGAGTWLGCRLRYFGRLLRMPPAVCGIFSVSQLAGYPVGTLLLRRAAGNDTVSASDAAKYASCCFGGGPAFLVGLAGVQLFGSAAAGWCIFGACVLANCVLALLMKPASCDTAHAALQCNVRLAPEMLTSAVSDAMRSLMQICGMVLLFGILLLLCDLLGITALLIRLGMHCGISPQTVRALLAAGMDITQLPALLRCGLPFHILLPLSGALLSFGGICVHFQCLALGGRGLHAGRLLCMRLLAALLTFLLLRIAVRFLPLPETAAVFAQPSAALKTGSPLPALLIFCTGFPFLIKKD